MVATGEENGSSTPSSATVSAYPFGPPPPPSATTAVSNGASSVAASGANLKPKGGGQQNRDEDLFEVELSVNHVLHFLKSKV